MSLLLLSSVASLLLRSSATSLAVGKVVMGILLRPSAIGTAVRKVVVGLLLLATAFCHRPSAVTAVGNVVLGLLP